MSAPMQPPPPKAPRPYAPYTPLYTLPPNPPHPHTHTLILLHGRGSMGGEFADELLDMRTFATFDPSEPAKLRDALPSFKLVFPTSPLLWAKTFQSPLPQWFDIASLGEVHQEAGGQVEGVRGAVGYLRGVVEEEVRLLRGGGAGMGEAEAREKVFVLGISQGAAVGVWALLGLGYGLGGFVGMNTWAPFAGCLRAVGLGGEGGDEEDEQVKAFVEGLVNSRQAVEGLKRTPVFLGHGTDDAIIDIKWGNELKETLEQLGVEVKSAQYQGAQLAGHWIKEPEGMGDIVAFLKEQVAKQETKKSTTT